jgi:D-alanine transaminase
MAPQIVMTIRAVSELPEKLRTEGAAAITVQDTRWGRCDIKTIQLLSNSLAKQKALDAGCDDAIFVTNQNVVREGTSSNLFMVVDEKLFTHPLTPNILPGITRLAILQICQSEGLQVQETVFETETLYGADEAFLTGTVTEVLPIVRVDEKPIGDGTVGPITRRLYALLRKKALA